VVDVCASGLGFEEHCRRLHLPWPLSGRPTMSRTLYLTSQAQLLSQSIDGWMAGRPSFWPGEGPRWPTASTGATGSMEAAGPTTCPGRRSGTRESVPGAMETLMACRSQLRRARRRQTMRPGCNAILWPALQVATLRVGRDGCRCMQYHVNRCGEGLATYYPRNLLYHVSVRQSNGWMDA